MTYVGLLSAWAKRSAKSLSRELPGIVAIAFGSFLYIYYAPSYILGGDHGEFAALSSAPGIAHPPGYPLFVMYLRLMSWLPGEVGRPSSLATVLLGSIQLFLLYVAARSWKAPSLASGITVAFFSASALAIHLNSHAEVFALNGLLAAAILALAGVSCSIPLRLCLFLSGLCFGLGFSHHHSLIFLFPVFAFTIVSACVGSGPARGLPVFKVVGLTALAFCLGLLPNLLLFGRFDPCSVIPSSWGEISSLSGLLRHFLRSDYGTFKLHPGGESIDWLGQQKLLFDSMWWSWSLLLPLSVIGFITALARSRPASLLWWRWMALLASVLGSGPLFASLFNMPLQPAPRGALLERFHFLPVLLLVVPVSCGLADFVGWCRRRMSGSPPRARVGLHPALEGVLSVVLVLFGLLFNASLSSAKLRDRHAIDVDLYLRNSLLGLPYGSTVIVKGDHRVFGYSALQVLAGYRPDIGVLVEPHWRHLWYRRRFLPMATGSKNDMLALLERYSKSGQAVFWDPAVQLNSFSARSDLHSYQYGLLRRFLRPGESTPSPVSLLRMNERLFALYKLPPSRLNRSDGWPMAVALEYQEAWNGLAADLERAGRRDLASVARRRAEGYAPCFQWSCKRGLPD